MVRHIDETASWTVCKVPLLVYCRYFSPWCWLPPASIVYRFSLDQRSAWSLPWSSVPDADTQAQRANPWSSDRPKHLIYQCRSVGPECQQDRMLLSEYRKLTACFVVKFPSSRSSPTHHSQTETSKVSESPHLSHRYLSTTEKSPLCLPPDLHTFLSD